MSQCCEGNGPKCIGTHQDVNRWSTEASFVPFVEEVKYP